MTLPLSGPMTAAMINTELGKAWNAPFSINGSDARALAGIPSGPIKMSDFYGKSGTPAVARSNMVAQMLPATADFPNVFGYDDGSVYKRVCGSLTPPSISYPGGAIQCRALFFNTAYPAGGSPYVSFYLFVNAGTQRNGTLSIRNEFGDMVAQFYFGPTWYNYSGGMVYTSISAQNVFVDGGRYQISMDT